MHFTGSSRLSENERMCLFFEFQALHSQLLTPTEGSTHKVDLKYNHQILVFEEGLSVTVAIGHVLMTAFTYFKPRF